MVKIAGSKKLKRQMAPMFWGITRKDKRFVNTVRPGPHEKKLSVPTVVFLKCAIKLPPPALLTDNPVVSPSEVFPIRTFSELSIVMALALLELDIPVMPSLPTFVKAILYSLCVRAST